MTHKPTGHARGLVAGLGLALAVAGLSTPPAWSAPDGTDLVISEVYGGGGNAGAPLSHDFVEIHNPTDAPVSLSGYEVEFFSSAGNGQGVLALSGTLAAGGHRVVRFGTSNASVGTPVPETTPSSGTNIGATNGAVQLRRGEDVRDAVGYGTSTRGEGAAVAYGGNDQSLQRTGGADTDDNAADFVKAVPTPGEAKPDDGPTDPGGPTERTIAEIQGTGTATPLAGQQVVTRGVVTAAYPEGGFDGFYLQTPGPDTTPEASDAVFVHSPGFTTKVKPGASVEVTGTAGEYNGLTQVSAAAADVKLLKRSLGQVVPKTSVPGTDCALPGDACPDPAAIDAAREQVEGEALQLDGPFTVTDAYDGSAYNGGSSSSANFGEIGLAAESAEPLFTPTDVVDARDTAGVAARKRYNDAHRVILDDGSSLNYASAANTDEPLPWHTAKHDVRVGAAVTFPAPVVLDWRFGWKLQPTTRVVGAPTKKQPQFEQTRKAPEKVEGELSLATFNVLNYFTTLGAEKADVCTSYDDRTGDPVTVNRCESIPNGPRGAWDPEDLERQQAKVVAAISTIDADVVSLEEIENSRTVDGHDRDEAVAALVQALNAKAGKERWAYVASPAELPASEDVIRTGLIYDPSTVEVVGGSKILVGEPVFDNARQPFAQAFRPKGGDADETFVVVVNHFKSKGSGVDDGTGQGNANPDRVAQAKALTEFAGEFAQASGTDKVFLTGDFNAYSKEDPVVEIEKAGYVRLESTYPGAEKSYSFDGQSGSLDHVFATAAARKWVQGVDVWESNANETVYRQYSRHNYNVTQLVDATGFAASDHNPAIVGFTPAASGPGDPVELQILSTNDFHGRLAAAGALAGAVGQLRADQPNTLFVGAGDQIGASTFESFIAQDKPTIDVLNAMGLAVSATGNHEFDAGYADLVDRVMAPFDATANPQGGAEWQYLAANVRKKSDGTHALPDVAASPGDSDGASWITEVDGVQVGFVGAVTEDLSTLVSPAGISELEITSIVDEVNASADTLTAAGADVVVMLTHEGAQDATVASATDTSTAFGRIVAGVDDDVDAIMSGHTHLQYAHTIDGRPVISAGEYGTHLSKVVLEVDPATDAVTVKANEVVPVASVAVTDPEATALQAEVEGIVAEANAAAEVLGAREVGRIDAPLRRAVLASGAENRGGESTLGNLVAEVHRWATRGEAQGAAEIAFMNPGGLRADLLGNAEGGYPAPVTYRQAAAVQPFANTLVNMDLTGAQVKEALEQQWQLDADGNVPTRPFLRLGASEGFTYTYDPTRAQGDRITGMWLNGTPVDPGTSYSVTVNSFLASGGDNFRAFAAGTNRSDTGQSDLTAMVDYMAATTPVQVDHSQRAVGVATDTSRTYQPGDPFTLDVSSWSFSAPDSVRDQEVVASIGGTEVGRAALDHTVSADPFDETGTARLALSVPAGSPAGPLAVVLRGATTGTEVTVLVQVASTAPPAKVTPTLTVTRRPAAPVTVRSGKTVLDVRVAGGSGTPSGTVQVFDGARRVGSATVTGGRAQVRVTGLRTLGTRTLSVRYSGDAQRNAATATVRLRVVKAVPKVKVKAPAKVVAGRRATVRLSVRVPGAAPKATASGKVKVSMKLRGRTVTRTVRLRNQAAQLKVWFARSGSAKVTVTYLGDGDVKRAKGSTRVRVVRR